MPLEQAVDVLFRRGYNLMIYCNNWEVSSMRAWTSSEFGRLSRFIDGLGGVILRRWGDARIRTLSLQLLEGELDLTFRQYRGLVLYHKAWHSTAGAEGS
jgi:hypothetical protein